MEREVGGGIGMGTTCKPMAVSFQCMTKSTTNKKIIIIIKKNFPWFVVIHRVKDFSIVNDAEADVFLEFSCLFYNATDVGSLSLGPLPFLNPA